MYGGGGEEGVVLSMGYANMWDEHGNTLYNTRRLRLNQDALYIIDAYIMYAG